LPDLLRLIGLARSTFYYQVQSQQKPDKYAELKERIRQVYHKEKGRYGYRRVALAIRKEGPLVNKKVVEKLMTGLGLKSLVRPKKYRSYRGTVGKIAMNLLERNFVAQRPNQKWTAPKKLDKKSNPWGDRWANTQSSSNSQPSQPT